jgi:hypothetical protein
MSNCSTNCGSPPWGTKEKEGKELERFPPTFHFLSRVPPSLLPHTSQCLAKKREKEVGIMCAENQGVYILLIR